jgi:hypothetical protein
MSQEELTVFAASLLPKRRKALVHIDKSAVEEASATSVCDTFKRWDIQGKPCRMAAERRHVCVCV